MAPGAMLLGSAGRSFECSHDHGDGDRCLSFQFDEDWFARVADEAGASRPSFERNSLPPLRSLAAVTMRAVAAVENGSASAAGTFEEIALELAGGALLTANESRQAGRAASSDRDLARIGRLLRELESDVTRPYPLAALAESAGMSRYHFLRTFTRVIGATPHQRLLRMRLREAARRPQAVAQVIEQYQRMITRGLEVAVVGALLLLAVKRNLGRVHLQHHPPGWIDGLGAGEQLAVDPRQSGEAFRPGSESPSRMTAGATSAQRRAPGPCASRSAGRRYPERAGRTLLAPHPPPHHLRTTPIASKPPPIRTLRAFYQIGSPLGK